MITSQQLYSLKMRAAQQNMHISGAENIVTEAELQAYCSRLLQRALQHSKGKPDCNAAGIAGAYYYNLNAGRGHGGCAQTNATVGFATY